MKTKNGQIVQPPKNSWTTIKRLAVYVKRNSFMIIIAIAATIVGTAIQVLTPRILGSAITLIYEDFRQYAEIDFTKLSIILLIVAMMYAAVFITTFLQQRIMVVIVQKTTYILRNELKAKMDRVPISYFDKNTNGNLMSVAINDIDNIVTNLQQSLTDLISSTVLLVGSFWMMITISPLMTGVACLIIPGTMVIMAVITPGTKRYSQIYYKSMGELNSKIEETYQGFSVIKSFSDETNAIREFNTVNKDMVKAGWKARFFSGITMPAMQLMQNIVYVLIAMIGSVRVVAKMIFIGDVTAFLQYSSQFSNPIMKISQSWGNFVAMLASSERVFEMLDAEEMVEYDEKLQNYDNKTSKVVFDHVNFGYTDELLIKDFSVNVQKGEMLAIVGYTGAGKTTLINLLERFYEIKGGSIQIDGVDIRNIDRQKIRKKIGMVLQDTWLFSGTIYDNIRYGNENATKEQIYAAAKAAYADDFIQKLPDGYNTVLNEDADNISQGQKQLITIARAFVSDPDILILDEASSNVDSRTELIIQSAMKQLLKGRTSFVVAHRLSTIYDADRILVMDKGNIAEIGTHSVLIEKGGIYADIYNSQFIDNKVG